MIRQSRLDEALALTSDSSLVSELAEEEREALLGEVHYHRNNPKEAEARFQAALRLRPSLAEGHYGLSLLYYDAGRTDDALAHAQYARNIRPDSAPILAQAGLCYIAAQDYSGARDVLRQAALLDPDNAPLLNNLGIALHATGDPDGALYYFHRALTLKPDYGPALTNLRNLYAFAPPTFHFDAATGGGQTEINTPPHASFAPGEQENIEIDELELQVEAAPTNILAAEQLIQRYLIALRLEDARDSLHVALAHSPNSAPLLVLAGRIAHMLGQHHQAVANYQLAVEQDPARVDALLGLSQVLRDQGNVEDALGYVQRAASHDDGIATLMQLAAALANACRYEECLATCDLIEARDPQLEPFLLNSRVVSHAYLGQFDVAMPYIDRLRQLDPGNFGLRCFVGILDLLHERYAEGWEGYRYRFLMESNDQRLLPFPRWQGEDLAGKTILILAEQGLGDQVMFASCLPDLLARHPRRVLLEAHVRVARSLERSFPGVEVVHSGQNKQLDWFENNLSPDFYTHIADLPYFFRRRADDFPKHHAYLLADPGRIAYWAERLRAANRRPKVGISWRGGMQKTRQRVRSLELERLRPLIAHEGVQFVNLQYGEVSAELDRFQSDTGLHILNFPEAIRDLDEFAALICGLDLVITVCNTTVHYTGALGKPCWVLAPNIPEWRYGLSAPVMPWYPSTRMFRQPAANDWGGVLEQVDLALQPWLLQPTQGG